MKTKQSLLVAGVVAMVLTGIEVPVATASTASNPVVTELKAGVLLAATELKKTGREFNQATQAGRQQKLNVGRK